MFDQQPSPLIPKKPMIGNRPAGTLPGSLPIAGPNTTSASKLASIPRPAVAEDIFSKVDKTNPADIAKPLQPGQASQMPVHEGEDPFGRRSSFLRSLMKIITALIALAILFGLGWAAYKYVPSLFKNFNFSGHKNTNTNVNRNANTANQNTNANAGINTNVNANTNTNANVNSNINTNANIPVPPVDTDGDGLTDDEEKQAGTDPKSPDTDNDGLIDSAEVKIYKTDPKSPDTDNDGYKDGAEVINGYNPAGPGRLFNVPK